MGSLLAGAWRRRPPPLSLSLGELAEATPLLLRTGAGALGWWRLRDSDLRDSDPALELRQAYRLHRLQAALHEREIEQAMGVLRSAGVEPLLAKGWAAARLYPERGLRPYGDIDLWVPAQRYDEAAAVLSRPENRSLPVELHRDTRLRTRLDRPWEQLYERSEVVSLGELEVEIRMPGPEDHLRLLCLHALRHGVWRALWLVDIAAAVEALPAQFDWQRCLEGHPRQADWVACAIGLAHRLLGAELGEANPVAGRAGHLPPWLLRSVVRQWGSQTHYMHAPSMAACLRHPAWLMDGLRLRWPNPIEATVGVGGAFNGLPRFPFEVAECVARAAQFIARSTGLRQSIR